MQAKNKPTLLKYLYSQNSDGFASQRAEQIYPMLRLLEQYSYLECNVLGRVVHGF